MTERRKFQKILIANRGEIAIRIARAASELGIRSVAVCSEDDTASLHTRAADALHRLEGKGPSAYLDVEQIVAAARESGCDAVHPGYGFLSESPALADACDDAGLRFVGPGADTLEILGDKPRARSLATRCGVPIAEAAEGAATPDAGRALLERLGEGGAVVVKAVAGGGGRGLRIVTDPAELESAIERCRSEAGAAFGREDVYLERRIRPARHIEVQIVGDGTGQVSHLWERECSLQRQHQKLVEIAPSPGLPGPLRDDLLAAAVRMAQELRYAGVGTFEFLVELDSRGDPTGFFFLEANPRLQVEHTVTEQVTGVDLVQTQLRLAAGEGLASLGLLQPDVAPPRGHAIQARVNMETMAADGTARPAGGTLQAFEVPTGPGLRTDTFGYAGYETSPRFDSLLAKVVAHASSPEYALALRRMRRALGEFRIEGVPTNLRFLRTLLDHPEVAANRVHVDFVTEHAQEWVSADEPEPEPESAARLVDAGALAGARVDPRDPLAVLAHGKGAADASARPTDPGAPPAPAPAENGPPGTVAVRAPMQATVISIDVAPGDAVPAGWALLVLEAMKMEHVITAPGGGIVREIAVAEGDAVFEDHPLLFLEEAEVDAQQRDAETEIDLDRIRPDLDEARQRHAVGQDAARPEAVARRRRTGQRTARENLADLCDEGSYVEYGALVIAAQRQRRPVEELIERTPADGLVAGVGNVNGALFPDADTRCVVMSYDYTVLAGTQGLKNHAKKDRMFELAERWRLPVVLFSEGGGGRPGDTDGSGVAGLDCLAFRYFGELSGLVPLVGINSGRCFAGNAALLGCCDVVIATADSNIGMGGPAMIEGGGLGVFRPEEVGPMDVQVPNGVVDVAVADEAEAVAVARRYLGYFQGRLDAGDCPDQRRLRHLIPENRLRIYDVRAVIETLADADSVLELRRGFGHGMVTALARIEGRPLGIIANDPTHLAGAIDSEAADKAARFMQLCDAFDLPIVFLCDTPGIMVGPEAEKSGTVRHASRMFVVGASLDVPICTIVLRKGYGLGAQAMAGGSFHAPFFTVAWPTGEFGGMGLEGAVKLGYRRELEALEDPAERRALYEKMVEAAYQRGKAVNMASHFEIDDVIDPADSRRWILRALESAPPPGRRTGKKRPCVDAW